MHQNILIMFRIRFIIFFFASLMVTSGVFAQDIHYTQYNLAPMTLNPSLTGKYEGTFRIGGLYRDQWRSVISNQFVTPSVYLDAPVFSFGKKHWIGVGAVLVNDKAGTVALTNTSIMGSLSVHFGLGSGNTVLSIGGQGGMVQKRVDKTNARFEDELAPGGGGQGTSADLNNIVDDNISYGDYNAGISLHSKLNKNMDFNIGFSVMHLSQPNYTTFTDQFAGTLNPDELDQPMRMVGHGQFNAGLSEKWTLSPTFLYQVIQGADEIMIQTMAGHHFNKEKDITLSFGAGYRLRDAASALLGFDYKGFKVGVAYDVNISDLSVASANRGGFELAASYIAKIRKPPVVKPVIFCPRF